MGGIGTGASGPHGAGGTPGTVLRTAKPVRAGQVLTVAQAATLWRAADRTEPWRRDLVHFLLAVPVAWEDALAADWADVEWLAPQLARPRLREHGKVHLGTLVQRVLADRWRIARRPSTGRIFPGMADTLASFEAHAAALAPVACAIGARYWAWWDFRDVFAAAVTLAGLPPELAAAVTSPGPAPSTHGLGEYFRGLPGYHHRAGAVQAWDRLLAAELAADAALPASTGQDGAALAGTRVTRRAKPAPPPELPTSLPLWLATDEAERRRTTGTPVTTVPAAHRSPVVGTWRWLLTGSTELTAARSLFPAGFDAALPLDAATLAELRARVDPRPQ